eukprot:CAMPEP_0181039360 /NCGR_PEP_ID=MMETSP1070-20121207/10431_1 /TAXON_ID=265543 /ORGANISM="Minutocellus polymorphus, Strain NH13" /LENGTH=305 /DNA_ID=CAMNT_0023117213 /DNA_START=197 /DNA_END=1114 /DNA_ORIENTATION=-
MTRCVAFAGRHFHQPAFSTSPPHTFTTRLSMSTAATEESQQEQREESRPPQPNDREETLVSPWAQATTREGRNNKSRFRQHVNPLARRFQMETELPMEWPQGTFDDPSLPLHLDIGCGKGGFLLELATTRRQEQADVQMNYLGLEIRPNVARHAKGRVARYNLTGSLDFIGCNANVDLRRLLSLYQENGGGSIDFVSIQFPDPHFKASHVKRRVVTPELVVALADFLAEGKEVFIQSDVQELFDDMREKFREYGAELFEDTVEDFGKFLPENPIGVPTEREISVLDQDLPVYRTIFRRTGKAVEE